MASIVKCCFDSNEMPDVIESMAQKCTDPGCKLRQFYNAKKHFLVATPEISQMSRKCLIVKQQSVNRDVLGII